MLLFDDFRSSPFAINNWLDQGDLFSLICYILYNAGLLSISITCNSKSGLLFVDNTAMIVTRATLTKTHAKLKTLMDKPDGVFAWAAAHNCEFGLDKVKLLDLTQQKSPTPSSPTNTCNYPTKPSPSATTASNQKRLSNSWLYT